MTTVHNSRQTADDGQGRAGTGTLLVIQHDGRNAPGLVLGLPCELKVHRSDLEPVMPSLDGIDGVIVGGGPMAAYEDVGFPSRKAELEMLREAVARGIPVLGICLGAQLLAVATGGSGYRRMEPEIGYLPVTLTAEGQKDRLFAGCPKIFIPRHKHFDSFEMPPGAVRLASSEECLEQGFRLGDRAWGLQFHFEMDGSTVAVNGDQAASAAPIAALAPVAHQILSNFCSLVNEAALED